ncbi:MAG: Kazal-type serine protease inhibitor family protein, partial [Acidimicrobiia bacterium]
MAALLAAGVSANAQPDPLGAGSGVLYMLEPGGSYQEGCLPPCLCPVMQTQDLRGTFKLVYLGNEAGLETYAVRDVNWAVSVAGVEGHVTGEGVYRIGSPTPITLLQHRLELDLRVGDDPAQHFDSGWVPLNDPSAIRIAVAMNGFFCFDRVFELAAARVPDSRIIPYDLAAGATFLRGCFDPCDCPPGEPRPMTGTLALVQLPASPFVQEFAVVDAAWQVAGTAGVAPLPIRGFGFYRILSAAADQHRLSLHLVVGAEPPEHFDSGLVPGGMAFPRLDATVSVNDMVCFDTVLHVIADPSRGLCGGIAGLPCATGEFCKLPPGRCCCDFMGICTPTPDACPDVWDPVCGCDQVTYGNECEADAAGVSVDHRGACESICVPTADRSACVPAPCSVIPEVSCLPTALRLDIATGAVTVETCDCRDILDCHVAFGNATPRPVGVCPSGDACEVVGIDTDGDGQDDLFTARCAPTGACCADLGGIPTPLPICDEATERQCSGPSVFFEGVGTTCAGTAQACCLPYGPNYCVDVGPECCLGFGGVLQGPGSTCADLTAAGGCPQLCGGIAGIPCDTGEFCNLPPGRCCCDFTGTCEPVPGVCPTVWLPVCGCDGVTYGNECEAAAAGVSIDHPGECRTAACCLPDGNCLDIEPDTCRAQGGDPLPGTRCELVDCTAPPVGACCLSDPAGSLGCLELTPGQCLLQGGAYQGDGTACPTDPNVPCAAPTGACCLVDAAGVRVCLDGLTPERCLLEGGTYLGDGTTCSADPTSPCPLPPSACCLPDGTCVDLPLNVCMSLGGQPQPGSPCTAPICDPTPTGACCLADPTGNQVCLVITPGQCVVEGGAYQGDGTTCPADPNVPCAAPTGACCLVDANGVPGCLDGLTPERCLLEGGAYLGDGTTCSSDPTSPCPLPPSACCLPDGTCVD